MKRKNFFISILILLTIVFFGILFNGTSLNEVTEDNCDVVPGDEPIDKLIVEGEKDNYPCEKNSKCEWRGVGGKKTSFYACCPKDLPGFSEDIPESLKRCFVIVD